MLHGRRNVRWRCWHGRARCSGDGRDGFADRACTQSHQERAHNSGKWESYPDEHRISDVWILSSRHGQRPVAGITNPNRIGHELYIVGKSRWSGACHDKTMPPRGSGCITNPPLCLQQPKAFERLAFFSLLRTSLSCSVRRTLEDRSFVDHQLRYERSGLDPGKSTDTLPVDSGFGAWKCWHLPLF